MGFGLPPEGKTTGGTLNCFAIEDFERESLELGSWGFGDCREYRSSKCEMLSLDVMGKIFWEKKIPGKIFNLEIGGVGFYSSE